MKPEQREALRSSVADLIGRTVDTWNGYNRQRPALFAEIASRLEAAGLLQSPESAAELQQLRDQVAEMVQIATGGRPRLLSDVDEIKHLRAVADAQLSRADTLNRLTREQRARAEKAEARAAELRADRDAAVAAAIRHALEEAADAVLQRSHGEPMRDAYSTYMRIIGMLRARARAAADPSPAREQGEGDVQPAEAPIVPRTERQRWQAIADALNAVNVIGIDLDGTLTDHTAWSVIWDRVAERWTVAGYDDEEATR